MKKIIATMIAVLMLCSITVSAASSPSAWASEEVFAAQNAGLTTSKVSADYQANITRENFCELVVKLYEKLTGQTVYVSGTAFVDTNNPEVLKAYVLGIVKGVSANEFAPYSNITRQEICVMLTRCIDIAVEGADIYSYNFNSFADSAYIAKWAAGAVNYAFDNGIIKGIGGNNIDPLGNTTCEQAVIMVYRIYNNYTAQNTSSSQNEPEYATRRKVIDLVNAIRKENGLSEFAEDSLLMSAAQEKALDMQRNNYFDHTSPTYGSPFDMMRAYGISYRAAGENIAMGQTSPEQVVNSWMNSQGHRANILNASYSKIGIGYVPGKNIWVQMFIG